MGNRTFLSVQHAGGSTGYETVAFETNNFLAPLWFCLLSETRFQQYCEQVASAWEEVLPLMGQDEVDDEDAPKMERFYDSLNIVLPWPEAFAQMQSCVPDTIARIPALAPYMAAWENTLQTYLAAHTEPVIHLELMQFFDFYEEPQAYLQTLAHCLQLWRSPETEWLDRYFQTLDTYELGGEHLPYRAADASVKQPDAPAGQQHSSPASVANYSAHAPERRQPPASTTSARSKRLESLLIWFYTLLSAALFLGILLLTSNMWLAILGFLLPSLGMILKEVMQQRRKNKKGNPS